MTTSGPEPFGEVDGRAVHRWTLEHAGRRARVLTWGGVLHTLEVPDRDGALADVVLGLPDVAAYAAGSPYFGALVGRVANRIAGGRFALDGQTHQVPVNDGPHALHGGTVGFDRAVWAAEPVTEGGAPGLRLAHTSPDGDMGFPGRLEVTVTYLLTDAGLRMDYAATTDAPTVVNLTNHAYFHLGGEGTGSVLGHELQVEADAYVPVDATLLPTGEVAPVDGTPFDFRTPTPIGARIRDGHEQLVRARGYDHDWVLRPGAPGEQRLAAVVRDPVSGRVLTVTTTEPGLQVYSGGFLDGTLVGKRGRAYRQGDAVTVETQHPPDAPNQPHFPPVVLRPGERFASSTTYGFSVS